MEKTKTFSAKNAKKGEKNLQTKIDLNYSGKDGRREAQENGKSKRSL